MCLSCSFFGDLQDLGRDLKFFGAALFMLVFGEFGKKGTVEFLKEKLILEMKLLIILFGRWETGFLSSKIFKTCVYPLLLETGYPPFLFRLYRAKFVSEVATPFDGKSKAEF